MGEKGLLEQGEEVVTYLPDANVLGLVLGIQDLEHPLHQKSVGEEGSKLVCVFQIPPILVPCSCLHISGVSANEATTSVIVAAIFQHVPLEPLHTLEVLAEVRGVTIKVFNASSDNIAHTSAHPLNVSLSSDWGIIGI